jgi:CRP-like cAMP-binding protein
MPNDDVERLLTECHAFAGVTRADFMDAFARPFPVSVPRGRTIFTQGQPAVAFFFMLEGWVQLYRAGQSGEPVTIDVFGPGETFAEALIPAGTGYPVSASTLTPARLFRIDCAAYRTLLATQPRVSLALITSVFGQLRQLVDQIESVKGWTLKRRVASAILRFVSVDDGSYRFDFPFERGMIAQKLGISPATLSRTFPLLASLGVRVTREAIEIEDVARLRHFVARGRLFTG